MVISQCQSSFSICKNIINSEFTIILEQNIIKNNYMSLYNILFDIEFTKHKKVVKDDNETFVRHYEFQKNYRQAIHLDIPDDENNF